MARHSQLHEKKNVVLHDKFSTAELIQLAAQTQRENESILRKMAQAPLSEQKQWCADAPKTFASSEFDIAGKPELADAVLNYKAKK